MTEQTVVIFSIGNPGAITRHSCGHLALKHYVDHFGGKQLTKSSIYSMTSINGLVFVKSNSHMNESDKPLKKFFDQQKLRPDQVITLIVYDDFESDLGKVKISKFKKNESHNGIKAIQKSFKDYGDNFYKLGLGIGPKPQNASKDTMASWVLSTFRPQEKEILENKTIPLSIDYIEYVLEVEDDIADCNKVNSYFTKNSN